MDAPEMFGQRPPRALGREVVAGHVERGAGRGGAGDLFGQHGGERSRLARIAARQPLGADTRALLGRMDMDVQATIIHPTFFFPDDRELFRTLEMVRHYVNMASNHVAIQHQRFSPLDRLNIRKF